MRTIKHVIIIMTLFCVSCNGKNTKQVRAKSIDSNCIKDTVIDKRNVRIFGEDSIYTFFEDSPSVVQKIEYLNEKSKITHKNYYEDGSIAFIEYNCELMDNSIKAEIFYQSTGAIWQHTFCVDTVIITDNNPKECYELFVSYHENGKMKFNGYFGRADGQISAVSVQKFFNESGKIIKTENFIYPADKQPYIIISEYYENEKPKWEKIYVNHLIHESEQEEPIGNWKYYDESGKLTRTEQYPENK